MVDPVPVALVDNFLIDYHLGHALILGFVLTVLGVAPFKSRKTVSLVVIVFGLIFAAAPIAAASMGYKLFGFALLVVGPMLYTTSNS